MAAEEGYPVELYIYDLTHGFASILAPTIIGREVEGVWHTSVVVYGREYFYGAAGVASCAPGGSGLGAPRSVERLGTTFVPLAVFVEYLQGLGRAAFAGAAYSLLDHNCNHFSDEVCAFLCGARVPKHVLRQADLLPPESRAALQRLLDDLVPRQSQSLYSEGAGGTRDRADSPDFLTLNDQVNEARAASAALGQARSSLADKLARKERRREKKRKKEAAQHPHHDQSPRTDMSEAVAEPPAVSVEPPAGGSAALDDDEREREEALRRARDPPIVYRDVDGTAAFEELVRALADTTLSEQQQQSMDELRQYLAGEGSWVLGDDFLDFLGGVLGGGVGAGAARAALLACLAACALRDDVALLLHQDRRQHALLGYAAAVEALPLDEQLPLATMMCNLFESVSASEWLLYISEWELRGRATSNIRVTTKVCVQCVLAGEAALRERGTALLYNLATKEVKTVVFDEVCVELCMAALQLLGGEGAGVGAGAGAGVGVSEEEAWRALRALARLAAHAHDVPQLIAMVGPDPQIFRGMSPRVDEQIDLIVKKVKA